MEVVGMVAVVMILIPFVLILIIGAWGVLFSMVKALITGDHR